MILEIACLVMAVTAAAEGIMLYRAKKQIMIINRIRVGYEKKCSSFQIKYTMLGKLENPEAIIHKVKRMNRPVYLYGGGVIGNKLQRILETDSQIKIIRVIETQEVKADNELAKHLRSEAVIIVTPMFDFDTIRTLLLEKGILESNIIGMDEIV